MIRIGILGDIGSGKSHVAKNFGYPVFNADKEVSKLIEFSYNAALKLIELHNGRIWLESDYRKGSTFYFSILKTFKPFSDKPIAKPISI